jgi:hypothetical protein
MEFFWQQVSTDIPLWKRMKNLSVSNRDTQNVLMKKKVLVEWWRKPRKKPEYRPSVTGSDPWQLNCDGMQNLKNVPSDLRVHAVCKRTVASGPFNRTITAQKSIRSMAHIHALQAYGHSRSQEMSSFHWIDIIYAVFSIDRHYTPARISWTQSTSA